MATKDFCLYDELPRLEPDEEGIQITLTREPSHRSPVLKAFGIHMSNTALM